MSKKELNFEINILPILDILSVLICFLLLTAVWIQLAAIDVKQAVGDNSSNGDKNPPSVWATVATDGSVQISLRDVKSKLPREMRVPRSRAGIDWTRVTAAFQNIKTEIPDLRTGIVRAQARTDYGDVVQMMDELRRVQITDIGLTPLSEDGVM